MSYKSLRFTKCSQGFHLKTVPLPSELKHDEILIKIAYTALNPVDYILYRGSNTTNPFGSENGFGREFSGVVEKVGASEKTLKEGDHVIGLFKGSFDIQGSVGEYIVALRSKYAIAKIAADFPLDQAASLPLSFLTARDVLKCYQDLGSDSKVLVLGGGTMAGFLTIQLLKNLYHVKDVVSIQLTLTDQVYKDKFDLAVDSVNYDKENGPEGVISLIQNKFHGEKFDFVIDCVGGTEYLDRINEILKTGQNKSYVTIVGTKFPDYNLAFFGALLPILAGVWKGFLHSIMNYGYRFKMMFANVTDETEEECAKLAVEGKIKPYIDSVYLLEDYQKAIDKMVTHKAKGKVLIKAN